MEQLVVRVKRTFVEVIQDDDEPAVPMRRNSAPPGGCRTQSPPDEDAFESGDSPKEVSLPRRRSCGERPITHPVGGDAGDGDASMSMSMWQRHCPFLKGNYWWGNADDTDESKQASGEEEEPSRMEGQFEEHAAALKADEASVRPLTDEAPAVGETAEGSDAAALPTTVIMRNLPHDYTRSKLVALVESEGFPGKYDFIYLPIEFGTHYAFGYAFVNLVGPQEAADFHVHFEGFSFGGGPQEKTVEVGWSLTQGLTQHVDRYRNSPMMHEDVPEEYKPIMLSEGVRIEFPPPTKKISYPHGRRCRGSRLRMLDGVQQKLESDVKGKGEGVEPVAPSPATPPQGDTMASPLFGGLEFEWLGTGNMVVPPPPPEHGAGAVARAGLGLNAVATPNPPEWKPWLVAGGGGMDKSKDPGQSGSGGGTSSDGDSSTQTPSSCARSFGSLSYGSKASNYSPRRAPFGLARGMTGSILAGGLEAMGRGIAEQPPPQQPQAAVVPMQPGFAPGGGPGQAAGQAPVQWGKAASAGRMLEPHSVVEIVGAYPSGAQGKILTVNYADGTYKVQLLPRGRIKVIRAENVRLISSARPPQHAQLVVPQQEGFSPTRRSSVP